MTRIGGDPAIPGEGDEPAARADGRFDELARALGRCPTRAAWCEMLVGAALAALAARRAVVMLDGGGRESPSVPRDAPVADAREDGAITAPLGPADRQVGALVVSGPLAAAGFTQADRAMLTDMARTATGAWHLAAEA